MATQYTNPIVRGFNPDPSILCVDGVFYMVQSTFQYFPAIIIRESRDLVNWRIIGQAITRPEWVDLGSVPDSHGIWAPDISYFGGRYWIFAPLRLSGEGSRAHTVLRRQLVMWSDRPEGPYSRPVCLEVDDIDPSHFVDDGRHYLITAPGITITPIAADCSAIAGPTVQAWAGTGERAPEGPHLLKKDGWYYLFLAEGGTGPGHRETVARARTLMGPYEPCPHNPILRQWDERALLQRCGHAKPVCTQHGQWYMVYLCGRSLDGQYTLMGRETALDPIEWTADGWPRVNGGRGPSALQRWPAGLAPAPVRQGEDWMTPRAPGPGEIVRGEGVITIRGSQYALRDVRCRSLLVRRQTALHFSFETLLRFEPLPEGGEAGITCYYDENSFLTFGIARGADGQYCLRTCEQAGDENRLRAPLAIRWQAGEALRLRVEARGLTRRLCWAVGEGPWQEAITLREVTYLSDEGVRIGKRFTGAMVGVYALAGAVATFAENRYQEEGA